MKLRDPVSRAYDCLHNEWSVRQPKWNLHNYIDNLHTPSYFPDNTQVS